MYQYLGTSVTSSALRITGILVTGFLVLALIVAVWWRRVELSSHANRLGGNGFRAAGAVLPAGDA
ncbi:hypothetical protein [Kutzneria kofuensis]|uniref:hypothetical protein n=1 Tax=Kutzneria kofuensis TaxID=103725 RepID=UPI0031E8F12D